MGGDAAGNSSARDHRYAEPQPSHHYATGDVGDDHRGYEHSANDDRATDHLVADHHDDSHHGTDDHDDSSSQHADHDSYDGRDRNDDYPDGDALSRYAYSPVQGANSTGVSGGGKSASAVPSTARSM